MNIIQHLTLHQDGWEALKKMLSNPNASKKDLIINEENKIIVTVIENEILICGYDYPQYQEEYDDLIYDMIYRQLTVTYKKMTSLIEEKKYKNFRELIVTPISLSSYPNFDYTKLPNKNIGYAYLTNYPNLEKKGFKLSIDEKIMAILK